MHPTGSANFLPILRKIASENKSQVMQLIPSRDSGTKFISENLVKWQCVWSEFINEHKTLPSVMRLAPQAVSKHILKVAKDSAQCQREIGGLGLGILMDVTYSMDDAIDEVRTKLRNELFKELLFRWETAEWSLRLSEYTRLSM